MTTTKKPRSRRLHPFEKELIASIENEKRHFDMADFTTESADPDDVATCGTASCMAGHIEALRRPLAKRLAKKPEFCCFGLAGEDPAHARIAAEIYRRETGKECPLDFLGQQTARDLEGLSRDDAVAHIKGINPTWPLLGTK